MRLVFLGAPGAGKGTQADELCRELKLPHISTGDIFRQQIADGTGLGKKVKEYTDSGRLVPDGLVIEIVADRLKKPDCADGYILDGFPRTLPQAEALSMTLNDMEQKLDAVVYFAVPDEVVIERLSGRRSCSSCGANYHIRTLPSAKGEACERCGAELVLRDDDRPETVKKRLEIYYRQTAELIDYYEKTGLLTKVNGNQTVGEIFSELKGVLGI